MVDILPSEASECWRCTQEGFAGEARLSEATFLLRFTVFTRCARELGEEDTRCKYQYFRAQCACPESQLEDWMEHRARGSCHLDVLPDRSTMHCRQ
mmetsp:Transcript_42975/g.134262  ORF Transcript_42975/g.134262 Transcript_42975/m.134262 type:complete len:96 (+) Transcript_42975:3-290(+)